MGFKGMITPLISCCINNDSQILILPFLIMPFIEAIPLSSGEILSGAGSFT